MSGAIDRRTLLAAAAAAPAAATADAARPSSIVANATLPAGRDDRALFVDLARRMAQPILGRIARGRLQAEWKPELSPSWDGRDPRVGYLEAFARLMDGLAPWLALPDDASAEGRLRASLRADALAGYAASVDPAGPDYLLWRAEGQPLVDSAFFTSSLLRAPDALWRPLDATTKRRIVAEIKGLRRVSPPYTNWLLFAATNEAFLLSVGEEWDPLRIDLAVKKFKEWYVGDGWYADGERFHFDYYNGFVIQPMLVQILEVLVATGARFNNLQPAEELAIARRRMQRCAGHLERMIGPDGAFATIGRSLTYRTGAHQPLALLAWRRALPDTLAPGRVRAATAAAQRRIFADPSNFDARGFLTLGFTRHQPSLADVYSNAGSMYLAAESLLALGLPATDRFWTDPPQDWTMRLAYAGHDFAKDYPVSW